MNRANEHSPLDDDEKKDAIEGIAEHLGSIMKIMRIDVANDLSLIHI